MSETVEVSAEVLREHLERTRETAFRWFAQYSRAKKIYIFDDDLWREQDAHGFELYDKLRATLPPKAV
jgi:hypothetical protein